MQYNSAAPQTASQLINENKQGIFLRMTQQCFTRISSSESTNTIQTATQTAQAHALQLSTEMNTLALGSMLPRS